MFKNYLKIAVRNITKNKVYSFINITGLAIGIAACMLIFLYIQNDTSFDKFNKNYKRIYRVIQTAKQKENGKVWALTPTGYANVFTNDFPGIKSVRLSHPDLYHPVIKYEDKLFTADDFIFADSTFFDIFSFPLLEGNPNTALADPFSIVLTQSEAKKIFGKENPIGKTIKVSNLFNYTITGVAKDPPHNSSVQFKYLASFVSIPKVYKKQYHLSFPHVLNNFSSSSYYTFLLLPKDLSIETVRNSMPSFLSKYLGKENSTNTMLVFQPLPDIHFNTTYLWDFSNRGDIKYNLILSAIALFILLIACVNFINISTSRSMTRAKEVGMRKVLGANRRKLILQFIFEYVILTLISVAVAIVLIELFLPSFNSVSGKNLSLNLLNNPGIIVSFFVVWILVVFIGCAYPSIYLSSFQPVSIIKARFGFVDRGNRMRKFLIVFQFSMSIFLISATFIILSQYRFLKSHKLGFDDKQVIFIPSNEEMTRDFNSFKTQLLQQTGIDNVSQANWIPGDANDIEGYSWTDKSGSNTESCFTLIVDPDFAKALGLKFISGRNFSWQMPSDWKNSFILNETAAKMMGWTSEEALGKTIESYHRNRQVIGVVKDFNFKSLRYGIEPVVMLMDSSAPHQETIIKISSNDIPQTLNYIKNIWSNVSPDFPFNYHFLDQNFIQHYQSEQKLSQIFGAFSILSVLIACLGLFGLAAHSTQERTKEMGIRKVLGASVLQVVKLISGDFIKLVLIANIIAWPVAYFFINKWLQNFAYRIDISWWMFVLSGGIALLIALFTVSYQAIKAAVANPVKSLRYE